MEQKISQLIQLKIKYYCYFCENYKNFISDLLNNLQTNDNFEKLKANEVGEILIKGKSILKEYIASKEINKSFETDQDLALALLFSKSAPEKNKIIKARSQILKAKECNKGVKSKISNTPIEKN